MLKRNGYSFTLAALVVLTVGLAFQADAGLLIFTSRDAWQSSLGGGADFATNFSTFNANTSFAESAINFGAFTLSTIGVPPAGSNQILVPPFGDDVNFSVDGTAYASMFLDSTRSVAISFNPLARAFGADFVGAAFNFAVFHPGGGNPEIIGGPTGPSQFFGIISTDPIDRIEFLSNGTAVTGSFDNVVISSAVPEPSSLMILGMGAAVFAAYSCLSLRRGKTEGGPDKI